MSSDMVFCFELKSLSALSALVPDDTCLGHVTLMSDFYPDNKIPEIPDPLHWRDSKSYDKCYWLVYKSVRYSDILRLFSSLKLWWTINISLQRACQEIERRNLSPLKATFGPPRLSQHQQMQTEASLPSQDCSS